MSYTLDELEVALAARITELDATQHQQGLPEVWTESDVPLTPTQDSVLQQHLAFAVTVEDATVVDDGNASGGFVSVLAAVTASFMYRLRSDGQVRDKRAAMRAAADVLGVLLRPSAQWGSARAVSAYRPRPVVGEWLPVDVRVEVQIDTPIPTGG